MTQGVKPSAMRNCFAILPASSVFRSRQAWTISMADCAGVGYARSLFECCAIGTRLGSRFTTAPGSSSSGTRDMLSQARIRSRPSWPRLAARMRYIRSDDGLGCIYCGRPSRLGLSLRAARRMPRQFVGRSVRRVCIDVGVVVSTRSTSAPQQVTDLARQAPGGQAQGLKPMLSRLMAPGWAARDRRADLPETPEGVLS